MSVKNGNPSSTCDEKTNKQMPEQIVNKLKRNRWDRMLNPITTAKNRQTAYMTMSGAA